MRSRPTWHNMEGAMFPILHEAVERGIINSSAFWGKRDAQSWGAKGKVLMSEEEKRGKKHRDHIQDGTGDKRNQKEEQTRRSAYYINQPAFGKGPTSWVKQQFGKSVAVFLAVAACICLYFVLLRVDQVSGIVGEIFSAAKPVIYGLAIAYLLNPIVKTVDKHLLPFLEKRCPKLKKKQQLSRAAGIFVSIVFLLAVVVALLNMMIPELYRSVRDMIMNVPSQMSQFVESFNEMNKDDSTLGRLITSTMTEVTDFIQNWMRTDLLNRVNDLMSGLTAGVINILTELMNIVIGLIVSAYVLFGKEKFSRQCKKLTYAVFKPSSANMILHLTIKSNDIFGGFIIGKIIDSAIIGVLCFIGLSILDMPYTMLVCVVVGVTNVIPFFGPYIGAVPSAVLILLTDPRMGIYFIIFIIALQQFDGNVLGPKILGDTTGLSAFWVVFSILIAGGLFGVPGMILGVPAFAVIYYIVGMLVDNRLKKKKLPPDTDSYDEYSYVDTDGTYVHAEKNRLKEEGEMNHADQGTE